MSSKQSEWYQISSDWTRACKETEKMKITKRQEAAAARQIAAWAAGKSFTRKRTRKRNALKQRARAASATAKALQLASTSATVKTSSIKSSKFLWKDLPREIRQMIIGQFISTSVDDYMNIESNEYSKATKHLLSVDTTAWGWSIATFSDTGKRLLKFIDHADWNVLTTLTPRLRNLPELWKLTRINFNFGLEECMPPISCALRSLTTAITCLEQWSPGGAISQDHSQEMEETAIRLQRLLRLRQVQESLQCSIEVQQNQSHARLTQQYTDVLSPQLSTPVNVIVRPGYTIWRNKITWRI